ncbi:peroxisome biogenesis factor 10 [Cryptotrichosporon argae]
MDGANAVASSSRLTLDDAAASDRLTFARASQAQILRAHQRDGAQVHRLSELAADFLLPFTGTRWLARHAAALSGAAHSAYYLLTLARGQPTLGEEYTDVLPVSRGLGPSRLRRLLAVSLLVAPSLLPLLVERVRTLSPSSDASQGVEKLRALFLRIADHRLTRLVPELNLVLFLLRGRVYDLARRLTGTTYISTAPPRETPSYEPLGVLLALPLLYRLLRPSGIAPAATPDPATLLRSDLAERPGGSSADGAGREAPHPADYDAPNTYLSPAAQALLERQCTLCLEPRGTGEGSGGSVAVTECGHVFCWGCLGGLEKSECPLCRQSLRMERLVVAYNL